MEYWMTQLVNGISYAGLLFLLAGGLTLIFGMMRVVNMTHGSYYLLGGYVGLTVIWREGWFLLAVFAAAVAIGIVGLGEYNAFLRRLAGQDLPQVLTTMGFALIFQDLGLIIWGGEPYTIPQPAVLAGTWQVGEVFVPIYRVFIVAVAAAIGLVLWVVLEWTRLGAKSVKYENSGARAFPKLSRSPTIRLPITAPLRLPIPPTITTTKA